MNYPQSSGIILELILHSNKEQNCQKWHSEAYDLSDRNNTADITIHFYAVPLF